MARGALDLAASRPRQPARERQSQAGARTISIATTALPTGLEDPLVLIGRDPRPVVGHAEGDAAIPTLDRDSNQTAGVAASVLNQGGQDPLGNIGFDSHPDRGR